MRVFFFLYIWPMYSPLARITLLKSHMRIISYERRVLLRSGLTRGCLTLHIENVIIIKWNSTHKKHIGVQSDLLVQVSQVVQHTLWESLHSQLENIFFLYMRFLYLNYINANFHLEQGAWNQARTGLNIGGERLFNFSLKGHWATEASFWLRGRKKRCRGQKDVDFKDLVYWKKGIFSKCGMRPPTAW